MHRFKKDVRWGKLLMRMRNGELTKEDVEFINTKVVTVHKRRNLPKDLRYATYFNRDRDAINTALFEECCTSLRCHNVSPSDILIVLADKLEAKTSHGTYEPFHNRKLFWENCGEDDIKFPKERNGRMDPLLKLYKGCQLMLVFNNNVRRGEANGTTVTLVSICLKPSITPIEILIHNLPVKAVYASQIVSIVLKHNNSKILPSTFKLEPIEFRITARILKPQLLWMKQDDRKIVKMKATQLPVISNQATTGHKLQGASINQLFVNNWNYTTNWPRSSFSTTIKRRTLFMQQIKYASDKIWNAVATTKNDTTVGKNSINILDKGAIQRPFQPCLEHSGITRSISILKSGAIRRPLTMPRSVYSNKNILTKLDPTNNPDILI